MPKFVESDYNKAGSEPSEWNKPVHVELPHRVTASEAEERFTELRYLTRSSGTCSSQVTNDWHPDPEVVERITAAAEEASDSDTKWQRA